MLFYMAITLGVVAAIIELRTAFSVKFIRGLIEKSAVIGIIFSVGLSMIIGMIFGAAGLVVMMGALIAAAITQPVYFVFSKIKDSGSELGRNLKEVKNVFMPFWDFIKFAFKLTLFPFYVIYKILSWTSSRKAVTT